MNKSLCTCGGTLTLLGFSRPEGDPYYFAECGECKGIWYVAKSGDEYLRK